MRLVDYVSSDSEADAADQEESCSQHQHLQPPPTKKRRVSGAQSGRGSGAVPSPRPTTPPLPPLPLSFHDLYAAAVRPATTDLPSLHQGRTRLVPHRQGNWPSHIYIEWHPPAELHARLCALVDALADALAAALPSSPPLFGFLRSDLAAPLPLHVSLSAPFVLRGPDKDTFAARLAASLVRPARFELRCDALRWHRSPGSARSFLVLPVRSSAASAGGAGHNGVRNRELSALLRPCNDLVASCGQPKLYANDHGHGDAASDRGADDAFHLSIAWSLAEPTDEARHITTRVFARDEFRLAIVETTRIPVECIKVKIGNTVTNIALARTSRTSDGASGVEEGLFGGVRAS